MQYLPNDDEREWLIRYLRKLIERAGWERFVRAPILEPLRTWFPEKWSGSVRDAHLVTQRLMHYAGLGQLRVTLDSYESTDVAEETEGDAGTERFDWAAYFTGIRDGRAHFGVQLEILDDPEKAAGTMAHEVAHAWRAQRKLVVDDAPDREELLTDITTVYLGFGIFTTNNTDRYRSEGTIDETRWSFSRVGYLPMQAMAFLLALQASARDDLQETAKIERHLEVNQLRAFREALDYFEGEDVLALLSLPPRHTWPEIERVPHAFEPYEPSASEAIEGEVEEDDPRRNSGRYIYRTERGAAGPSSYLKFMAVLVGAIGVIVVTQVEQELRMGAGIIFAIAFAFVVFLSYRYNSYVCSDTDCAHPLSREIAVCPGCGGMIAPNAEEALERNSGDATYVDCSECEPEMPCARHA